MNIEKNIPIPAAFGEGGYGKVRGTLNALEVGDSFLIGEMNEASVRSQAYNMKPKRFTIRNTPDGYRAWRTA